VTTAIRTATPTAARVVRALAVLRCAEAAVLLIRPRPVGRAISGRDPLPAVWVIRLLGARMLAQGAVELAWPTRQVVLAGSAVDAGHAASMIGAAAALPTHRRTAMASAIVAGTSAVVAGTLGGGLA
jgi:hypothetical protein